MSRLNQSYDILIKILIIGDSGVGKSCLLLRFSDDSFTTNFITTIGIDFKTKTINIEGKKIKIQIWDTAGQERFRTITTAYYRGAQGIMLVYDVTNEQSFLNVKNWMSNIEKYASNNINLVLVGNKCECIRNRIVTEERAHVFANEHGIKLFETSAKNNINVTEAFCSLIKDVKHYIENAPVKNKNDEKEIKINALRNEDKNCC